MAGQSRMNIDRTGSLPDAAYPSELHIPSMRLIRRRAMGKPRGQEAPLRGESLWHALPSHTVLERLGSGSLGLTEEEAAARLTQFGPNTFRITHPHSAWSILFAQFRSVMVVLLLVAGAVSLVSGDRLDAVAILAVLILNVAIG